MSAVEREYEFTQADFRFLRELASRKTGIVLKDDKFNMLYSRLSRRIRLLGLGSFKEYCRYLENDNGDETTELINSVTTNLTSFFREKHHFDYLRDTHFPMLLKRNSQSKKIRIWSAGCSTGEEPYTLAITILESGLPKTWDIKILATDIDRNVVNTGRNGVYNADRIDGLSAAQQKRWFEQGSGENANKVRAHPDLKKLISFKQLNLLEEWPFSGPFDAIFCRNVVIYFDVNTKKGLVERYSRYMHQESCLFLGHSESLFKVTDYFDSEGQTVYRKNSNAA
ncbi:MAG: protein-glutamate O-methyltransferase [Pseudomonadota bacterium]